MPLAHKPFVNFRSDGKSLGLMDDSENGVGGNPLINSIASLVSNGRRGA
jgi:hypothetical protein